MNNRECENCGAKYAKIGFVDECQFCGHDSCPACESDHENCDQNGA